MWANKISGHAPISRRRAAPRRVALNPSTRREFWSWKNVGKAEGAHRCNLGVRNSDLGVRNSDLGVPTLNSGVRINIGVSVEASQVSILFTSESISLKLEYQFEGLRKHTFGKGVTNCSKCVRTFRKGVRVSTSGA